MYSFKYTLSFNPYVIPRRWCRLTLITFMSLLAVISFVLIYFLCGNYTLIIATATPYIGLSRNCIISTNQSYNIDITTPRNGGQMSFHTNQQLYSDCVKKKLLHSNMKVFEANLVYRWLDYNTKMCTRYSQYWPP